MENALTFLIGAIILLAIVVFLLGIYSSAVQGSENTNQYRDELPDLMKKLKNREVELQEYKGWKNIKSWPRKFLYEAIDKKIKEAFEQAQEELDNSLHQENKFSLRVIESKAISWRGLLSLRTNLEDISKNQTNRSTLETLRGHLSRLETELKNLRALHAEIQEINKKITDEVSNLDQRTQTAISELKPGSHLVNELNQIRLPLDRVEECTRRARIALSKPETIDDIQFAQTKIWLKTGELFLQLSSWFKTKLAVPSLYHMDLLEAKLQSILSQLEKSLESNLADDFELLNFRSLHLDTISDQLSSAQTLYRDFSEKSKELEGKIDEMKGIGILEEISRAREAEQGLENYWGTMEESGDKWKDLLGSDRLPSRRLQSRRNRLQKLMPQLENIYESKIPEHLEQLVRILGEMKELVQQVQTVVDQTTEEKRAERAVRAAQAENGSVKTAIDDLNKIITKCEPGIAGKIRLLNEIFLSIHEQAQVRKMADYPTLERELLSLKGECTDLMEQHRNAMETIKAEAAVLDTTIVELEIEIARIEPRLPSSSIRSDELKTTIREVKLEYNAARNSDEYGKYSRYIAKTEPVINRLVVAIAAVRAEIAQQQAEIEELKQKFLQVENSIDTRVTGISESWRQPLSESLQKINEQKTTCQLYQEQCGQLEQHSLKQVREEIDRMADGLTRLRMISNRLIGQLHEAQTDLIDKAAKIEEWIEDVKNSPQEPGARFQLSEVQNTLEQARREQDLSWAVGLLDKALTKITAPTYYDNRRIRVGNIDRNTGQVVVGNNNSVNAGPSDETIARLFTNMRLTADTISDLNKRIRAHEAIQQLEAEAKKGERADEGNVSKWLDFLLEISVDVWDVAISTFLNPVKGIALVFKRVAERARSQRKRT